MGEYLHKMGYVAFSKLTERQSYLNIPDGKP